MIYKTPEGLPEWANGVKWLKVWAWDDESKKRIMWFAGEVGDDTDCPYYCFFGCNKRAGTKYYKHIKPFELKTIKRDELKWSDRVAVWDYGRYEVLVSTDFKANNIRKWKHAYLISEESTSKIDPDDRTVETWQRYADEGLIWRVEG